VADSVVLVFSSVRVTPFICQSGSPGVVVIDDRIGSELHNGDKSRRNKD
jgi:hypothetical protein